VSYASVIIFYSPISGKLDWDTNSGRQCTVVATFNANSHIFLFLAFTHLGLYVATDKKFGERQQRGVNHYSESVSELLL
jgi:hypothetical protein